MFVHLHNHSQYSVLDALSSVSGIAKKTKACGMPAVAITDHGNMFGAYEFYKAAQKYELKPIIGLEAYLTPGTPRWERKRVQFGDGTGDDAGWTGVETLDGGFVVAAETNTFGNAFGITLIKLSKNTYTADAYFTTFGNPSVGDYVKKYGERTAKTEGKITKISVDPDSARHARMESTLVNLPGDSGSAWVGTGDDGGPMLLGLNIGFTKRADGGYGFAVGYPIRQLVELVRNGSEKWGPGFIPVGP